MKTLIPLRTTTLSIFIGAGFLTLVFIGPAPHARASDKDAATSLDSAAEIALLLGNAPETALPLGNTADGAGALASLTTGAWNSAFGAEALNKDTTGSINTAIGLRAMFNNTQGTHNVAGGGLALFGNTTAIGNVGLGYGALYHNTGGLANTALGALASVNVTGQLNVTVGAGAGINITTGSNNIALGALAGADLIIGSDNIDIGNRGVADDANVIRIGDLATHDSVFLAGIGPLDADAPNEAVLVDPASGLLGRAPVNSVRGLAAVLFDFNNGTITIGVGGAVPFSQPELVIGTAISKNNNTTFMVNELGLYRVSYTLRTAALSLLANVQLRVNGVGVGPTAALAVAGTSLSDQVTFIANAGDTLQLVVGGVALTLGTGDNATINIDKLR